MSGKLHNIGAIAALAALLTAPSMGAQTIDPNREGYDVMRQITSQFLAPNIMIVLDSSGSLSFPVVFDDTSDDWLTDRSSTPEMAHSWLHLKTTSSVAGSTWDACLHIGADYTVSYSGGISGANDTCRYRDQWGNWQNMQSYPHSGAGHGYWVRMANNPMGFTADSGATTYTGAVSAAPTQDLKINCSSGNPVYAVGDVIQISSFDDNNNGIYKVATVGSCSGKPKKSAFTFYRALPDGTFATTAWSFTANTSGASLVKGTTTTGSSAWYFVPPSRMAILKNALGPHIAIYQVKAGVTSSGTDAAGKRYYTFAAPNLGPVDGAYFDWSGKAWANWDPATATGEPVGDPDFTDRIAGKNFVYNNQDNVNWGLITYQNTCDEQTMRVPVDPANNAAQIALIQGYMATIEDDGLAPWSATPTIKGLERALDTDDGLPYSYQHDPKKTCNRTSAVMLITDGQSNYCNPSSGNWNNCDTDAATNYTLYPAGQAETLWNYTSGPNHIRTFVIGVSPDVGACELNYTAFRGRTDASSPNADAGFETADDPYLPGNSVGYCVGSCTVGGKPYTHGDYAYFANDTAGLVNAFASILGAFGAGDYTTAAPSVSAAQASDAVGLLASAEFPTWKGHLYAYDLTADCSNTELWDCTAATPCGWVDPDTGKKNNCLWDAGEVLSDTNRGLPRRLFTWNPAESNEMVELTEDNLAAVQTIAGCAPAPAVCPLDGDVLDFMRGGLGAVTSVASRWRLGPLMNSTPAIVEPPKNWLGSLSSHTAFQSAYQGRHQLVWVGSSDGFLHAFDLKDGAEVAAVIPPTMLGRQVTLYDNFQHKPQQVQTGQPRGPASHIFGMANSPRWGDVFTDSTNLDYTTMLFATEGPGAEMESFNPSTGSNVCSFTNRGVHALDITHPFPGRDYNNDGDVTDAGESPDPCFGYPDDCGGTNSTGDPVKLVWSKRASDTGFSALAKSWSVPALGATDVDSWQMFMGAGFDPCIAAATSPTVFRLDATTGAPDTQTLTNSSTGALLRNQSFADAVFWGRNHGSFNQDNVVDEGLQADLNGQLWKLNASGWSATRLFDAGSDQPLYYPPAVAAYPVKNNPTYSMYAFGSGTFYEKSPNVTGSDVGNSGSFIPTLYLVVYNRTSAAVTNASFTIKNLLRPGSTSVKLGRRTQLTAAPMIFSPRTSGNPFALFLLYDPDANVCIGQSYIVKIQFDPSQLNSATTTVYDAGAGAAAGFAVSGTKVILSHSYVAGQGNQGRAYIAIVPDIDIPPATGTANIVWWRELQ